jgi:hypothetical protein
MFARDRFTTALPIAVVAAALLVHAPGAQAAGKGACVVAYKAARKLEQSSQLREAQRAFSACSKASCGAAVRRECLMHYEQLSSDIPSVVPVVTDAAGEPVLDVKVTMDGELLTSRIDGRAVAVDPGLHEFSFSTPMGAATQKIVILQGQRNRPLSVSVSAGQKGAPMRVAAAPPVDPTTVVDPAPAAATAPPPSNRAVTVDDLSTPSEDPPTSSTARSSTRKTGLAPYLLTGVGLAGVGGYALLTYWGRKDNDMLATCRPNCLPTSVDHVRKLYTAANISLGVGVAALGTATWLFLRSHGKRNEEVAGQQARRPRYALDVVPVAAGAVASVRGGF